MSPQWALMFLHFNKISGMTEYFWQKLQGFQNLALVRTAVEEAPLLGEREDLK